MYKTCVCKGIGDLYATHSITVCTIEEKMYIVCKISAFQVHMQLGCVDTANGYGVCKKCIAFITRNPLDISACFKLPFLLYIYCTLVTMRLHTG